MQRFHAEPKFSAALSIYLWLANHHFLVFHLKLPIVEACDWCIVPTGRALEVLALDLHLTYRSSCNNIIYIQEHLKPPGQGLLQGWDTFLQGITTFLTANGVSFNWNKHNVMERVRWLPLCLRGGMASRFFHGWKVREGGRGRCNSKIQAVRWKVRNTRTQRRFLFPLIFALTEKPAHFSTKGNEILKQIQQPVTEHACAHWSYGKFINNYLYIKTSFQSVTPVKK